MLHEYRDIISHMKANESVNAHFLKIFDKHNDLDNQIIRAEHGSVALTSLEIEKMKKEKLHLKDEAYTMIMAYKKENNL
ncbi:MAG: YdcH family protein [Campylobacterota bacterium]|nr:YdcH family protein [Campylobacterota bacterium]